MTIAKLTLLLTLVPQAVLIAARPELSVSPGTPTTSPEVTIQGSTPGMHLQLLDGVWPIGAMRLDGDGKGRLTVSSLASGQHTVRAVEWGTGKRVGEPVQYTAPAHRANGFAPGTPYPIDLRPGVVTTGDVDGDGLPSVILAGTEGVSILRNKGGSLGSEVRLALVANPVSIVVQDFDGDGWNDLAVASEDGRVTLLLNHGNGEFAVAGRFAVGRGPSAMAGADFNGDGIPDLAVANERDNTISILLGNGDGTFRLAGAISCGDSPRSLAAADFNGDGAPDLATANFGSNNVSILLGDGKGGFRNGGTFATGNGPASLAAADFDENGAMDLAVLNQLDGTVGVLLNDGAGGFSATAAAPGKMQVSVNKRAPLPAPSATSLAAADADGDGHVDLVLLGSGEISVRTGNGDGNFNAGYATRVDGSRLSMALADFNRDGRLDLAAADFSGTVTVIPGAEADTTSKSGASPHLRLSPDATTSFTLTFEGLQNNEQINNYYNGGFGLCSSSAPLPCTGSSNSGPGPNYGITFGSGAVAVIALPDGGTGDFSSEPSCCTVATFESGGGLIMNVPAGFTTGFSFYFSNPGSTAGTVTVWSGLNGTGTVLATLTLATTSQGCDTSGYPFDCWVAGGASFQGIAQSVNFSGAVNGIAFDNITIGNTVPQKLIITTTFLSNAVVGVPYSQTLTAINGTTPYTWSATGLPTTMSINPQTGVISGTPNNVGTFTVTVTVTDKSNPQLTGTETYPLRVGLGSTTSLVVSPDPSVLNSSVTMTAVVSPSAATGTVAFLDGSSTLSNATVTNGTATLAWSALSAGTHSITAVYSGDANYLSSSSTIWTQTVEGTLCTYTLTPSSASVIGGASTDSVSVTAPAGCTWTASSNSPNMLSVTSGASGSGNGTVGYTVLANTGASRTGSLTIAGETFNVTQAGSATTCSYALSQSNQTFLAAGGSGSIGVVTQGGCPWTVSSSATWVTITAGGSGTGDGTVKYTVAANSSTNQLTAVLSIGGQSYVISESGTATTTFCNVTVPQVAQVALEGETETAGNMVVNCSGLTGTTTLNVLLTLNSDVTNQVTGGTTDATLQTSAGTQNGQMLGFTTLYWPGVTLTPSAGNATFIISNVRVNASLLSPGANQQATQAITGQLTLSSTTPVPVLNGTITMATAAPTLTFQVGVPTTGTQATLPVTYQEATATGFHLPSESTPATRFRVVVSGVPNGVQVWGPISAVPAPAQAQMYTGDCSGNGGGPASGTTINGQNYSQLALSGSGVGSATWVVTAVTSGIDTLTFPLLIMNPNNVSLSSIQVVGSLAPANPAGTACGSSNPSATVIPRYRDFSVPLTLVNVRLTTSISITNGGTQTPLLRVVSKNGKKSVETVRGDLRLSPSGTAQQSVNFESMYINESSSQAQTNATVKGSVPTGANQIMGSATGGGTFTPSQGGYTCTWGSIAAGSSQSCSGTGLLGAGYSSGSTATNSAAAGGDQTPADPTTVTASSSTTVGGTPELQIQTPALSATLMGTVLVTGWALEQNAAIANVQIFVTGSTVGSNSYADINLPETVNVNVCGETFAGAVGCPNVGFSYALNTTLLPPGSYGIIAVATDVNGNTASSATVPVTIATTPRLNLAVWRPSNGFWYVNPASGPFTAVQWGLPGDVPVLSNFDGVPAADYAVWRPSNGTWYVMPSTSSEPVATKQWGIPGDVPVPGDYDGDGLTDYAVWRPSNGTWYIVYSGTGQIVTTQWGIPGDVPIVADFDGDGKIDYAVWRPSDGMWYIVLSSTGQMVTKQWGLNGDKPVAADFDGDGKADYAVWRPAMGNWYVTLSSTGQQVVTQWGINGDIPVPYNYDLDKKADYAVFRPSNGTWYIMPSTGSPLTVQWGLTGDIPIYKPAGN